MNPNEKGKSQQRRSGVWEYLKEECLVLEYISKVAGQYDVIAKKATPCSIGEIITRKNLDKESFVDFEPDHHGMDTTKYDFRERCIAPKVRLYQCSEVENKVPFVKNSTIESLIGAIYMGISFGREKIRVGDVELQLFEPRYRNLAEQFVRDFPVDGIEIRAKRILY